MGTKAAYDELLTRFAEIKDLQGGLAVLGWDQEVMMPQGGAKARAETLSTLTRVVHERMTARPLTRLVNRLHGQREELKPRQRRAVELARRAVKRATALPADLAAEIARAESQGLEVWRQARSQARFDLFAPALEHMVALKREVSRCLRKRGESPYDPLLDEYEPGARVDSIDPLLTELSQLTERLLRHVQKSPAKSSPALLCGDFPVNQQRAFAREVALAMGFDFQRGRLDVSTHPFCGGSGPHDVRMTGRFDPADLRGGLFGVIHETGHGLYEQGLHPKHSRTPLGGAVSMAVHESQSRLWENMVARSRPFWQHWMPKLAQAFPHLAGVTVEAFWRAANHMEATHIRVEADELTYNLHIALRYEIERDLFEGRLEVKDIPERWNEAMSSRLGVTPPDDGRGCLQDIHWAMGAFGYFPTYSLGNLYAAQLMDAARDSLPELDSQLARGDFAPLRNWLAEAVHAHCQIYDADRLLRRVTGKPLSTAAFERYITAKVEALYGPLR